MLKNSCDPLPQRMRVVNDKANMLLVPDRSFMHRWSLTAEAHPAALQVRYWEGCRYGNIDILQIFTHMKY